MSDPGFSRVPLTIGGLGGERIGTATVYEDGRVEAVVDPGNPRMTELFEHITAGNVEALSIAPVMEPATPFPHDTYDNPIHKRGFTMRGVTGVQFGHGNNQVNNF